MHYIRFLKPPRLLSNPSPVLSAKITITTDLGEAFLYSDITIVVELESPTGEKILGLGNGKEYLWKGRNGMRSLDIAIPVPKSKRGEVMRVLISPRRADLGADNFQTILTEDESENDAVGRVMAVRSMNLDVRPTQGQNEGVKMANRILSLGETKVCICEETGESIARHIWYDHTGTSCYFLRLTAY